MSGLNGRDGLRVVIATAAGIAAGAVALGRAVAGPASTPEPRLIPSPPTSPTRTVPGRIRYTPDASEPYGPKHKRRRPSGLPTLVGIASGPEGVVRVDGLDSKRLLALTNRIYSLRFKARPAGFKAERVRNASRPGAALAPIADVSRQTGLGESFVKTMVHLAKTEGEGGTFAVPARNFNAACRTTKINRRRLCTPVDAPRGDAPLITAWGVFQWNRDAGRELAILDNLGLKAPPIPADWQPWDWSATEEIAVPIDYYAQLWRLVRKRGGTVRDAARGVRLWHTGPNRFRRYYNRGADAKAWTRVQTKVTSRIDRHLAHAGVV